MTTAPNFTVDPHNAGRIRVAWEDTDSRWHFVAKVDGDRIAEICGAIGRSSPTVTAEPKERGGRPFRYSPENAELAPIVAAISARILTEGLATKARAKQDAERA